MKVSIPSVLVALLLAIGLGLFGQSSPAGDRPADLIQPVGAAWYRALPRDPDRATRAYLDRVPPVMRERGEAISRTRYWALAARIAANIGAIVLLLQSGAAAALGRRLERTIRHSWLRDLIFGAGLLVYVFLFTLPVEVGASYVRYRSFGFSDQPFFDWLEQYALEWLGSSPFYAVGIAILIALVRWRPRSWFIGAGLVYLVLATLNTIATPLLIEPMTNSYTPLPDGPARTRIVAMAKEAGIAISDVSTSDASRQSRRLNGHVSGALGSARITINDTALGASPAQIAALAAHEMGHFKMAHPLKMGVFASLVATLGFALIAWLGPLALKRYGNAWQIGTVQATGAIAVFWLLFTAWGFVADPITNSYARAHETQADAFSLDLAREPNGLADLMIQDADIARLEPTLLDVLLFYDHPSDPDRVEHAMRWRADHI